MAGNTEEAVALVQAEAANVQGVQKHHKSTLDYISERIFSVFVWDRLHKSYDRLADCT